jgi:hypothetical protein
MRYGKAKEDFILSSFKSRGLILKKANRKKQITLLAKKYKKSSSEEERACLLEQIMANIYPLILHILKSRGFPYDLFQECKSEILVKVLEGLETYNPVKFKETDLVSYLATRFLEGIDEGIRRCGFVVTLPRSIRKNWLNQLRDLLGNDEVDASEVGDLTGLPPSLRKNYYNRLRERTPAQGEMPVDFPEVDFKNHFYYSVMTPDTHWEYHSPEPGGFPAEQGNELTVRQLEGPSEDISVDEGLDFVDSRWGEDQVAILLDLQRMQKELRSDKIKPWERRALTSTLGLFGKSPKTLEQVSWEFQDENKGRGSKEWIFQLRAKAVNKLIKKMSPTTKSFRLAQVM